MLKNTRRQGVASLLVIWGISSFIACGGDGGSSQGDFLPIDFETYVDSKEDTGYVSNKAAELEAKLASKVFIDLTGKSASEIETFAASLQTANRWTLEEYTSPQLKYARNPLKTEKLDLNLERGEVEVLDVQVDPNGVWLSYSTAIESLVKFKELQDKGLTPADLVGKKIDFLLPTQPSTVWEKGGVACASDPDGAELNPADVRQDNFFFYFDPAKPGCPLNQETDLASSKYEIISSLDAPSIYPEYDLLTQDKKITMVAIFGQIEHGVLKDGDWGWTGYRQFMRSFKQEGFTQVKLFDNNFGEQIKKVYPGGLEVVVDFITPEPLKDERPREEVNQRFIDWIKNHEIVYYNGHAFYGSLTVLDSRDAYPQDTYQVIFMDACWSYAYYTKQVFKNKVTESDPTGMKYSDVVNNTEPGITGSHETAFLLYKNIFKGASDLMQGKAPTKYSWNNLIVYMNENADQRARYYDPEKFHAEIYGASGVSANCFNPQGPSFCKDEGGSSLIHDYPDNSGELEIPDNSTAGATKTLQVPDSFVVDSVAVKVDIKHSYIGDLKVVVAHNGVEAVLHANEGGGSDDLRTSFQAIGYQGMDAQGDWTLTVIDNARGDTGKIVGWGLAITEKSSNPEMIKIENSEPLDILDNDPNGVVSVINVDADVTVKEIQVHLKMTHSYLGDLVVSLEHNGAKQDLMNREGASSQNLDKDFFPTAFNDQSSKGEWKLLIVDSVASDIGSLESWSLNIVPANE